MTQEFLHKNKIAVKIILQGYTIPHLPLGEISAIWVNWVVMELVRALLRK